MCPPLAAFFNDFSLLSKKVKFDQITFSAQNVRNQILKESLVFPYQNTVYNLSITSREKHVTLHVNCQKIDLRDVNAFFKRVEDFLKVEGIENLTIESIEINFDFESKTQMGQVCQDLTSFSSLFQSRSKNALLTFHSYEPKTILEDLKIGGKKLTSSVSLNVQYRKNREAKGIALYDFKIYCKGIERALRKRQKKGETVIFPTNLIRVEVKLKRKYLSHKERGKIRYQGIILDENEPLHINQIALCEKISFRFSSMASKIREACNSDYRTRPFFKELVQQLDSVVPMRKNVKNSFSSFLKAIDEDWLL